MGFQDNSGDIILDVVLTDEGRKRLARGDGSFEIVKFGCGDDEINYGLYDLTASSAQQDLSILHNVDVELEMCAIFAEQYKGADYGIFKPVKWVAKHKL